ncbi:HAD family hydrolase [Pseudochryseolinea flava]|nr:HAD family phosphatase [Pseudochryseolinea flava]
MKYAFLFDMDGVIIDSNPFHKIALKEFCKRYGHDLDDAQLHSKIYGRTNKDWIPNVFGDIPREQVAEYGEEKEAMFREIYKHDVKPLKGLLNFLAQAEELKIDQAIATSAPRSNVDFTLQHTGIEKYFKAILDEAYVSKGKPDPEIYIKTAAALGYRPDHCVVFEDSLSGVQAGKAAGCKVVGISTTHSAEELNQTDLVIADFDEITVSRLLSILFKE